MQKFIFSRVAGFSYATLVKTNFLIGIFKDFGCKFYLVRFRTTIFNNTHFFRTPAEAVSVY